MSSTTSSAPTASPSPTGNAGGGGGPTNSPLLFFVALGFGVVFTNLWIIVGVKYCFRYNQRNRQRQLDEAGNPIDLGIVPRPQRRRREKKLMSMDEVNDRFPLTKYKAWRSQRAMDGLPTEGGVTAPPSRAASIKDVEGVNTADDANTTAEQDAGPVNTLELAQADHAAKSPTLATTEESPEAPTAADAAPSTAAADTTASEPATIQAVAPEQITTAKDAKSPTVAETATEKNATTNTTAAARTSASDDDSDAEDDPIRAPAPPELLTMPGDTCAICIDNLEEDDDVRGLTCGHAFHAACVDPWLTSRRACCPLCKADYYVPKPRNPGEVDPNDPQANAVREPGVAYLGRTGGLMPFTRMGGTRFFLYDGPPRSAGAHGRRPRPFRISGRPQAQDQDVEQRQQQDTQQGGWWRSPLPGFRRSQPQATQEVTPSDLEAGAQQPNDVRTQSRFRWLRRSGAA